MMKRLLSLLVVFAMLLATFVGCAAPADSDEIKIGIAAPDVTHGWVAGVAYYAEKYCKDQGITEALVTTAAPMDQEQEEKIREKLCAMTGKKIIIKTRLDESLLGGVLLEVDGKRYDDTLKGRLQNIRSQMAGETENTPNAID